MAESSGNCSAPELPRHLIHHILSFLSCRESAKASILSKAWFWAWQTRPELEFNSDIYTSKKLKQVGSMWYFSLSEIHKNEICKELFEQIKKTLKPYSRQGICVDTVNLTIGLIADSQWNPLVQKCAKGAVKNGVRNLDFSIPECDLPEIVFRAKSLVDLSVSYANITRLSVGEIICCGLRKLCLMRVNLNVEMFDNIIECCPLIEVLQVLCIMGFDDFKVTKLNNLKDITIWLLENQRVEVEAPKLELLTWDSVDLGEEDTVVRPMTCWITLPAPLYQNLKSLILRAVRIVDNFFMDLDLAGKFPSLEALTVSNCIGLQIIKISNRSLKRIQLIDNRQLVEAQFDVPSIVSFKYCSDSYIIPQFLFSATSRGWTSYIFMTMRGGVETSWFVELKGLVASLSQSEISVKLVFKYLVAFDIDEIGNIETIHEPQEVQELSFATEQIFYFVLEKVTLINGLLWVCRPKNVNSRWIDNLYQNEAVKYLYEMLMFRRIQDQFRNLQKMMFWQHDLMEVNIEVGDQIEFGKEGKMELQQKDLDWEDFLKVLRKNGEYSRTIYFNLEWRTHDMPRS